MSDRPEDAAGLRGAAADDRLVTLGDYVDRGPDSRGVLDLLIGLHAGGRLIALRGNHDEMMVDARIGSKDDRGLWLACGGRETLASYGVRDPETSDLKEIPESHWTFLERDCLDWYETETHFFVHANAYPDLPLDEQPRYMLLWEKLYVPCVHISGKVMVCGHTRQTDGRAAATAAHASASTPAPMTGRLAHLPGRDDAADTGRPTNKGSGATVCSKSAALVRRMNMPRSRLCRQRFYLSFGNFPNYL